MVLGLVPVLSRRARSAQRAITAWAVVGLLACVLLPWYFPQDLRLVAALRGVWGLSPIPISEPKRLRRTSYADFCLKKKKKIKKINE